MLLMQPTSGTERHSGKSDDIFSKHCTMNKDLGFNDNNLYLFKFRAYNKHFVIFIYYCSITKNIVFQRGSFQKLTHQKCFSRVNKTLPFSV